MKKKMFLSACFLAITLASNAQHVCEALNLQTGIYEPGETSQPRPKAPACAPQVIQQGFDLSFSGNHTDYTLCLIDENEDVVYTTYIPASVSSVALPSCLSGTYEIRLLTDSVYFYGWITL